MVAIQIFDPLSTLFTKLNNIVWILYMQTTPLSFNRMGLGLGSM